MPTLFFRILLKAQSSDYQTAADGTHAKSQSEGAGAPEIIPHRMKPNGTALTAGDKGLMSPPITYHGGSVMYSPSVYLIWYGNWKLNTGSDTPAGQDIIRDFLFGLAQPSPSSSNPTSDYYMTNTSYPGGIRSLYGGE